MNTLEDFSVCDEVIPAYFEIGMEAALVEVFKETQLVLIYDLGFGTIVEWGWDV